MKKMVFLAGALAITALPALAEMPSQAAICVTCHQANGLGMPNLGPSIAGMPASYLATQIEHFKKNERQSATMKPMADMLDEAGVKATTEWFASLPLPLPEDPAWRGDKDPASLTGGEKLAYLGDWRRDLPSCVTCHGPEGVGVGEHIPHLAGQHADYIEDQLKAWQAGTRVNDINGIMGVMAKKLTAEEITAVAQYFANVETK